jgi:hypothetical protein
MEEYFAMCPKDEKWKWMQKWVKIKIDERIKWMKNKNK